MTKQDIINNAITELIENAISVQRENIPDDEVAEIDQIYKQVEKVFEKLSPEDVQTIEDYIDKSISSDRDEFTFLYVQGAKDCVKLLKALGII